MNSTCSLHILKKGLSRNKKYQPFLQKPKKRKSRIELKKRIQEHIKDYNVPKNSLTIAAEPRRVMMSLATDLDAITGLI